MFSSEGKLSNRSNDSWSGLYPVPFTITPNVASIAPYTSQTFKVTFHPSDVFQYVAHLQSNMQHLRPDVQNLDIIIKARSILPLCHFDIESLDVDLVRRGRKICGEDENENVRIVKFEAVGLREACIR